MIAVGNWPQALAALRSIIDDKAFRSLPSEAQYRVLSTAGRVAIEHGPPDLAHEYLQRVTAMPQADYPDWARRLDAAYKLKDDGDSIKALTLLMQRWPDRATKFDPDDVFRVAFAATRAHSADSSSLLKALYDAHWKQQWDIEPSKIWWDLSLRLIENSRLAEAGEVASHVTDVYVLIAMRADRRFDAVVAANSALFDIEAASRRELQTYQTLADKNPHSLYLRSLLINSLLNQQHYEAALAASDSILQDIRSTNFPERLFEDFAQYRSWFFELRSTALERVGRWDEAVAQLIAASRLTEKYSGNVDQLIDLGNLYCSLRRPKDALSAVASVAAAPNPYGAMVLESVRMDAASQLEDSKQERRSVQYLRSHRSDAPIVYWIDLITLNRPDQAAHELVAQLMDPGERRDALMDIQTYAPTPESPRDVEFDARHRAVIAMPKVQEAIRRVGRVESYALESP
jgi:tetratricopeptide (TPR) repeat protein